MLVYIIHPKETIGDIDIGIKFYSLLKEILEGHITTVLLHSEMTLIQCGSKLQGTDALVFFNRQDQNYSELIDGLLEKAVMAQTEVFPIAISKDHRIPHKKVNSLQSFDITDELFKRALGSNYSSIAHELARVVLSSIQPTLCKNDMKLFISYRRIDGEELALNLYKKICVRAKKVFRDLNICCGANSQEVIEENICDTDVVVFIDTPKAGESKWINFELKMAILYNIPVLWVNVNPKTKHVEPKTLSAESPHIEFDYEETDLEYMVDSIIKKAFELARNHGGTVFDYMSWFQKLDEMKRVEFRELEKKQLFYEMRIPRFGFKYPQKSMIHLIQLFGRNPQPEDEEKFTQLVNSYGYMSVSGDEEIYDAGLLLAPTSTQKERTKCKRSRDNHLFDSFQQYTSSINKYFHKRDYLSHRGLIISGAFPDSEPEYHQYLHNALHAFVQAILDRNMIIIFGGHPTFQPIIFDLAKSNNPDNFKDSVHLYVSRWFVSDDAIEQLRNNANVTPTVAGNSRSDSLSIMREAMLKDEKALGLVVIGGKTREKGHEPGVDEEFDLALNQGIPIFIVGGVGGRSAELASKFSANHWKPKINSLTEKQNDKLAFSLDFVSMANLILDELML